MASLTHRERIVQALRPSSRPLDDDQMSERTQIRPGQAVNQACRALERAGVLRRYQGLDRKIVNELATAPAATPPAADGRLAKAATAAAGSRSSVGRSVMLSHRAAPGNSATPSG